MRILIMLMIFVSHVVFAEDLKPQTYQQAQTEITISKEQPEFILKLKANPTTGYTWLMRSYDRKLIRPIKQRYEQPEGFLIGQGGYEYLSFKVLGEAFLAPTETKIKLMYSRPWDPDQKDKSITFTIKTK